MSSGRRLVPLADLVESTSSWNPSRRPADESFTYIDLTAVDQDQKAVTSPREVLCADAPSRARQLVRAGDVLVSTVRPNLNAVAAVPPELDAATASTGFCVLRPIHGRVDSRFLFHWVRTPAFVEAMVRQATGASYPAVSDRIVLESKMPVPGLDEQGKIAELLDRVDALRAKRRATLALLDSLTSAVFLEMFGDPVTNPEALPVCRLSELGTLDRGVSKHRPRNAPELLGGPYPLIQTGEIANCEGYLSSHAATYSEAGLNQSKLWPRGTLCITIAANIAKTGILMFDACFPDSVVGFRSDPATVEYVRVWLSFLQKTLEDNAPESAQKNINLALLRQLPIPVPSIAQRRLFADRVAAVRRLKSTQSRSEERLDELFASLQHQAFIGEL